MPLEFISVCGPLAGLLPSLSLPQRARHVFSEAYRVRQFRTIALSAASSGDDAMTTLSRLGSLMNDSHHSCSQLYECR